MIRIVSLIIILSFLVSCSTNAPKNIILFIGDGMGPAQITALETVKENTNLSRFKTAGFVKTHSLDKYVTDSAAGATAMATGHKTYNGAISVDTEQNELKTVLEYAEDLGKSTGLIATCSITHATPAAFAAHDSSRGHQIAIAEDIAQSGTDVIIGGGLGYFLPQSDSLSLRKDDKNLLDELKNKMNVVSNDPSFKEFSGSDNLLYLYAKGHPGRANERTLSLSEMTRKALDILSQNPNGFFLMVEGSQIDWAGHANEQDYIIGEILDFDDAVGAGLDFAEKNTETLVVVTADHETGGFALLDGSIKDNKITETAFTTTHHSGVMVPVFAFGPASTIFGGIIDNTLIGQTIIKFNQK